MTEIPIRIITMVSAIDFLDEPAIDSCPRFSGELGSSSSSSGLMPALSWPRNHASARMAAQLTTTQVDDMLVEFQGLKDSLIEAFGEIPVEWISHAEVDRILYDPCGDRWRRHDR